MKILLARLHNSNRALERVKRGEAGPFTFPWELQEIARTFTRANSAVTKWRAELESCGAASYGSGSWTLPVPELFRETQPGLPKDVSLLHLAEMLPALARHGRRLAFALQQVGVEDFRAERVNQKPLPEH